MPFSFACDDADYDAMIEAREDRMALLAEIYDEELESCPTAEERNR